MNLTREEKRLRSIRIFYKNHPGYRCKYSSPPICIKCGKEITSRRYKMCKSCANRGENNLMYGKISPRRGKKFGRLSLMDRKNKSKARLKFIKNHPEIIEEMRQRSLDYIKNHPGPWRDTKPELKMKEIFISLNIPFKHQVRIKGIPYVWDFIDEKTNTLIEVDGKYYHTLPGARERDYRFNHLARKKGYRVLRFWDKDIMKNEEKVIERLEVLKCLQRQ